MTEQVTENLKRLLRAEETDSNIAAFIAKYSAVLEQQAANAKAEAELIAKLNRAVDMLLK